MVTGRGGECGAGKWRVMDGGKENGVIRDGAKRKWVVGERKERRGRRGGDGGAGEERGPWGEEAGERGKGHGHTYYFFVRKRKGIAELGWIGWVTMPTRVRRRPSDRITSSSIKGHENVLKFEFHNHGPHVKLIKDSK